jgi:hypothetical protein
MQTQNKDLDYYRKNAEEDYLTTPISVLRYISEMEAALRQPLVSGSLQDRLFELANDFAVAKKGEVAVKLHSIHNGLQ